MKIEFKPCPFCGSKNIGVKTKFLIILPVKIHLLQLLEECGHTVVTVAVKEENALVI